MKKLVTYFLLFLLAVVIPIGCSNSQTNNNANSPATSPNSQQTLNLFNWSTYIDPAVIADFEKENNIKIKYDTYESNEDLYSKIKGGNPGYDIIFPADYMVKIMISEGLLEPLDLTKLPNQKNISSTFLNPSFDPGNKYTMPYQIGSMGLGYNIKATGQPIDSWSALLDPKYQGKIAVIDDMRATFAWALIALGYSPNTTNPDEINQAKEFLIKNKGAIAAFAPDTGQQLLVQGEVDIAIEWSGDVFQVMKENPDIRYVIPKEGSLLLADNMAIPKGAPNRELAHKFIDFILMPENGARISNYLKYGSPNQVAKDQGLIDANDLNNRAIYPPPELLKKMPYLEDVGESTKIYDQAWTEVKAAN
jgi:spermidine/putrescine transport system substrate-binding protein